MAAPKKKKKQIAPEEKIKRAHARENRNIFTQSGFTRIPEINDKAIVFKEVKGDFDDYFLYENILIIGEYTTAKSSNISDHLKKKKIIFDKVLENQAEFISYLKQKFPKFSEALGGKYLDKEYIIKIFYSSKNTVDDSYKKIVTGISYLDNPVLKYFQSVVGAVKKSTLNELFSFFDIENTDIVGGNMGKTTNELYKGSMLPEPHSGFENDFKVVSFYVDPAALLHRSYVLRNDGWRDGSLYQRMISKTKIDAIRKHLKTNQRVFINNIIVTLPSSTKILDDKGDSIDISSIAKTVPVNIQLPNRFNSIGIIDGQHRVFAYHEGGHSEEEISKLRARQNLLVTGIIYPDQITDLEKSKFEAKQFLEINSNQTNAKSDLKQAIGLLLNPFDAASIGKQVINRLNSSGPLCDMFERHFFDDNKIKTTSIVSYGLIPIVKLQGDDSFYSTWNNPNKGELYKEDNTVLLKEYVQYCTDEINEFLLAIKFVLANELWTPDKRVKGRVLTTTAINGFIICLREIISSGQLTNQSKYQLKLADLSKFKFSDYHSSQYGRMGRELFAKYFKTK